MTLPNGENAEVPGGKIRGYLLSRSHPVGSAKARYFASRGYRAEASDVLERDLRMVAKAGEVRSTEDTEWGIKYVVAGSVTAPDGGLIELATVWMVGGGGRPVLVTAYPWKGGDA
jgi:hypothetical protein